MNRLFFGLALLVLAGGAYAAQPCSDMTLRTLANLVQADHGPQPYPPVAHACKRLPGDAPTLIAIAAFGEENIHGDGSKQQVLALLDEPSGQVLASHQSRVEEDALTLVGGSTYLVDTAAYRLAPDVRAFGTVFRSAASGPSCPDASFDNELTLWVRDGNTLRPVLGTNLQGWVNVQGETCRGDNSPSLSESAKITIAVQPTRTNGFADLLLTARVTPSERDTEGNFHDRPAYTRKTVLTYDGTSYGSDMYRNFWYPESVKRP